NNAPSVFPLGHTTVTWTATDEAGNSATCTQNVTVKDHENPTANCPANKTQSADAGQCSAVVTYTTPAAGDNCSGATQSGPPASGSTFAKGANTVTCTATDSSGNTTTCSFTITVNDTTNPAITCPASYSTTTTATSCSSAAQTYAATATDNCAVSSVTCAPAS